MSQLALFLVILEISVLTTFEANHKTEGTLELFPTPPNCGVGYNERLYIYSGIKVGKFEFPWMVFLSMGCGGTLINSRWVLTAAHCVVNIENYVIFVGAQKCRPIKKGYSCSYPAITMQKQKSIVHEDFYVNQTVFYNDMALVKLKGSVQYDQNIRPICLPYHNEVFGNNISNRYGIISGWGETVYEPYSERKLRTDVRIWTQDECEKFDGISTQKLNSNFQICAGGLEDVDACQGDSGGPLLMQVQIDNGYYPYYQVGIISFGFECGSKDFPGVYTNLSTYLPWIRKQMLAN